MAFNFTELDRIFIVRLSSLGDILLTTPLIRIIKKRNPEIQIDFMIKDEFAELMQNNPYITNLYKYTESKFDKQMLTNAILSKEYNLVVDLQNNFRSKEILRPFHGIVFKHKKDNFKKFLLVHYKINLLKDAVPVPERYANIFDGLYLDDNGLDFFTSSTPDARLQNDKINIGLCPGSKHFTKRWPLDYFIELGNKLESAGYKIVLFGGPDEIQICNEIESKLNDALNLCNASIQQVGADMKMCKAIYTNDSGLMHLASAVKVPVIAFFGSTVKEFGFFPYQIKNIVLENKNLNCRPCTHIGRKSCPKIHFECMKKLDPDLAFRSLNKLLTM